MTPTYFPRRMSRPYTQGILPFHTSSAVQEKFYRHPQSWWLLLPICRIRGRRIKLPLLNINRLARGFCRIGPRWLCLVLLVLVTFTLFALTKRFFLPARRWPRPFPGDPPTLVFSSRDINRIWIWEVASGHYPSRRKLPKSVVLNPAPSNPALPATKNKHTRPGHTHAVGPQRVYLDIQSHPPSVGYPPRPIPGSIADLDVVMQHCDFSEKKYVRDCLEVLRVGAGLDNGMRMRRGNLDAWRYIYLEELADQGDEMDSDGFSEDDSASSTPESSKRRDAETSLILPPPSPYHSFSNLAAQSADRTPVCDSEHPRIFHMFWTGPFTDKPYLALLSFLYTQNLQLHDPPPSQICRPSLWLWINPGPAASTNPSALRDMFEQIKSNHWASPFLHPRFKDVIQFKLWNTTEQLDAIPELKDEWRDHDLFNSGGVVISVPSDRVSTSSQPQENPTGGPTPETKPDDDNILNRTGSKSSNSYDRLSVILSDMARFILTHRFGGIYLDADTIFLRDWEDLWGWKGSFAYRWSRLEKYNSAVLHLNKVAHKQSTGQSYDVADSGQGSALGTFLFRTALKNNLDFHPMTVSRYLKEASLEGLMLRLPDALFDSAWLNTEYYQRDRPPQPYFTDFGDLFDTPSVNSAAPQALGFKGFFTGAYSYHFHNYWWKPFDPARNYPDIGERFMSEERTNQLHTGITTEHSKTKDNVLDDQRDLSWATVLKRTFEAYIRSEQPNMYGEWIQY